MEALITPLVSLIIALTWLLVMYVINEIIHLGVLVFNLFTAFQVLARRASNSSKE